MFNAVQKKKIEISASMVDTGSLIFVRSGPTSNPSDVVFLNSEPNSVRAEEADFRSWVIPTSMINRVPKEPRIGDTNNVSAGIIGMMFCCANCISDGGVKNGSVNRYGK